MRNDNDALCTDKMGATDGLSTQPFADPHERRHEVLHRINVLWPCEYFEDHLLDDLARTLTGLEQDISGEAVRDDDICEIRRKVAAFDIS